MADTTATLLTLPATPRGITLPARWRRRPDPAPGVLLSARPARWTVPGPPPELVLHRGPVALDLVPWRDRAMRELADLLPEFELEDEAEYDVRGAEVAYRRFSHRVSGWHALSDQWAWLLDTPAGGVGLTLTGTVAREDYPDWYDVFEAVADTLDPAQVVEST